MKNVNIFLGAAIVVLIIWVIYLKREESNIKAANAKLTCFDLPNNIDPEVFGPKYWAAFHSLASKVPCPGCRGFAEKEMVFFHDLVNLKTGKKLYDPDNFNKFTGLIADIKANNNVWPNVLTNSESTLLVPVE